MTRAAVLLTCVLGACFIKPSPQAGSADGGGDAASCASYGAWNARSLDELNTPFTDFGPYLSPDHLDLYFTSNSSGTTFNVYHAHRDTPGGTFSTPPDLLSSLGTNASGMDPFLSDDQLTIWISKGGTIQTATRTRSTDPFPGSSIVVGLPATGFNGAPTVTMDGSTMLFSRAVNGTSPDSDIWRATGGPAAFGQAQLVPELSVTGVEDCCPTSDADATTVMFESRRNNQHTIWMAAKGSASTYDTPVPFQLTNTGEEFGDPHLTRDGKTLVYAKITTTGMADLWIANRSCP